MSIKLYYFDTRGYCEHIRYILHYAGLKFEDIRITDEDWPKQKEIILSPPLGTLPLYVDKDVTLYQSSAIAKYVASKAGLLLSERLQEIKGDAVLQTMNDFLDNLTYHYNENDKTKKDELRRKIIEEYIPYYFSRFDKLIAENNGYIINKLSWADIQFVAMVELTNELMETEAHANYENVKALIDKVLNLKEIKKYIKNRSYK